MYELLSFAFESPTKQTFATTQHSVGLGSMQPFAE